MEKENFHDGFENLFREKLENIEYPYSSSDWSDLQKGLRKQGLSKGSAISASTIISVVVSSVIILSSTIYFLQNNNTDVATSEKIITNSNAKLYSNNNAEVNNYNINKEYSSKTAELNNVNCQKKSEINNFSSKESKTIINEKVNTENTIDSKKDIALNEPLNDTKIIPNADFSFDIVEGCTPLKVKFVPNIKCDSMIYLWSFGDGSKSTDICPTHTFEQSGKFNPTLTTKYYRTATINTGISSTPINVKQSALAEFNCEIAKQNVTLRNLSSNFEKIEWSFGDNESSILEELEHKYKVDGIYNLKLIAYNNSGCNDTLLKKININIEHEYFVPTAFKPNGDSKNETFGPIGEGLDLYQYEMYIYNRFNNLIFESKDVNIPWNGKIKGTNKMAETGVYVWFIITKDKNGNIKKRNGNVTLLN